MIKSDGQCYNTKKINSIVIKFNGFPPLFYNN